MAPAGYEVEFDFLTREMVAAFRSHKDGVAVVNGVSMNLPVDTIQKRLQKCRRRRMSSWC